eukprot:4937819-Alexandrium_andersonii.AAC.1
MRPMWYSIFMFRKKAFVSQASPRGRGCTAAEPRPELAHEALPGRNLEGLPSALADPGTR